MRTELWVQVQVQGSAGQGRAAGQGSVVQLAADFA
jgi:hypothetical protein